MKHSWFDTFMSWYWGVWFLVGFGVMEGVALATKRYQNTLSEWTWRVFEVVPGQTVWQYRFAHIFAARVSDVGLVPPLLRTVPLNKK